MNKIGQTGAIKICFFATGLTAVYALLSGRNPETMGGPDVHVFLLVKELIKHDFEVSVIVQDEGGEPIEYINDVEILKIGRDHYSPGKLNTILSIFRTWDAMRRAKAHIYIRRGGDAGFNSPFCKLMKYIYICQIASDSAVNSELIVEKSKWLERFKYNIAMFGYWLDIKLADAIIVQNEYQRAMLRKNFGRGGILIKKPFLLTERGMPEKAKPPITLWVGAMAEVKQPELFLKLAEAIPEGRFQMIGGPSGDVELYNRLKDASKRIPNLDFLGVVPFQEVNEYFSRAAILVNTSKYEAYPPHAFIQAWMNYIPVVSLGDNSDEVICRYNQGLHSNSFQQLITDVKFLLEDRILREKMGANGREYVEREHDIASIIREYIRLFNHLVWN